MDGFNGEIVAYKIADNQEVALVKDALSEAIISIKYKTSIISIITMYQMGRFGLIRISNGISHKQTNDTKKIKYSQMRRKLS